MVGWKNSSSLKSPSRVVPGWWQNGSRWNANVLFEKNRAKKKREGELMLLWENEAAVVLLQEFRIEKS